MAIISPMVAALARDVVRLVEKKKLPPNMKVIAENLSLDESGALQALIERAAIDPSRITDELLNEVLKLPKGAGRNSVLRLFGEEPPEIPVRKKEPVRTAGRKRTPADGSLPAKKSTTTEKPRLPYFLRELAYDLAGRPDITSYKALRDIYDAEMSRMLRIGSYRTEDFPPDTFERFSKLYGFNVGVLTFNRSGFARHSGTLLPPNPSSLADDDANPWKGTPVWKDINTAIFAGILPYIRPISLDDDSNAIARIRSNIAHKQKWFDDLTAMGVTPEEIVDQMFYVHQDSGKDIVILAIAELRRFAPVPLMDPRVFWNEESEREILVSFLHRQILDLHHAEMDSGIDLVGDDFTALLPPVFNDMSYENLAKRLLAVSIGHNKTILYWHMKPCKGLAERILERLSHVEYDSFKRGVKSDHGVASDFLQEKFRVSPMAFEHKLAQLAEAGIDVGPIRERIRNVFHITGPLDKTPGNSNGSPGVPPSAVGGAASGVPSAGGAGMAGANYAMIGRLPFATMPSFVPKI